MAPVEQSLQQLLNSGYAILAMGTGLSFTLRQGNIWVVCSVRTASEAAFFGQRNATVESKCHRLN